MAKGFGGKYFSLQAITATVSETTLHKQYVRTRNCHTRRFSTSDDSIDESPPDELDLLLEAIEPFTPKVSRCQCHCNCFFRRHSLLYSPINQHYESLSFLIKELPISYLILGLVKTRIMNIK